MYFNFFLILKSNFNLFFPYILPNVTITQGNRITLSNSYIYIYNCHFYSLNSESKGVAIFLQSTTGILIEKCSFYFCISTRTSGSIIQLENIQKNFFSKNCIYDFTTKQDGAIFISSTFTNINLLSLSKGYSETNNIMNIKYFSSQSIFFLKFSNISNNLTPSLSFGYFDSFENIEFQYLSIKSNYATDKRLILFSNCVSILFEHSNIFNNSHFNINNGLIYFEEKFNLTLKNSIFLQNSQIIFEYVDNSYTLNILNSYFDYGSIKDNTLSTFHCENSLTETLFLTHFLTHLCYAEIPYLDPTPFKSPHWTVEKTLLFPPTVFPTFAIEPTMVRTYPPIETLDRSYPPIETLDRSYPPEPTIERSYPPEPTIERSYPPEPTPPRTYVEPPTPFPTPSNCIYPTEKEEKSKTNSFPVYLTLLLISILN